MGETVNALRSILFKGMKSLLDPNTSEAEIRKRIAILNAASSAAKVITDTAKVQLMYHRMSRTEVKDNFFVEEDGLKEIEEEAPAEKTQMASPIAELKEKKGRPAKMLPIESPDKEEEPEEEIDEEFKDRFRERALNNFNDLDEEEDEDDLDDKSMRGEVRRYKEDDDF